MLDNVRSLYQVSNSLERLFVCLAGMGCLIMALSFLLYGVWAIYCGFLAAIVVLMLVVSFRKKSLSIPTSSKFFLIFVLSFSLFSFYLVAR
jgi:hypothetical protein